MRRVLVNAPLHFGFAATGIGVALPGALLPVLLQRWHLQDEQGGQLFLLAWIGSSLGALLVHGSMRTTLFCGSAAVALAAVGLSFCDGRGADPCMALYGLGLGLTMTSISLIRQQQSAGSGTELVRLNLLWAIGACACPSFTIRALTTGNIRPVLCGLALCFAVLAAWTMFDTTGLTIESSTAVTVRPWTILGAIPAGLVVMTVLVPGIEASAGGWLATFARRGGYGIAGVIAAPTCFWAGLLFSRLFWSVRHRWLTQDWTVRISVILMSVASLLLVTSSGVLMLLAAFCLGFGIGPTYPLLLAWALRFHRGGAIFFLAGVASACLPWLTGLVSTQRHSLRVGFAVPILAATVVVTLSLFLPLREWSGGEAPGTAPSSPN